MQVELLENRALLAANLAPFNSFPGNQQTEVNVGLVFSTSNGNAISISDPDAQANPVQVSLLITNGNFTLNTTNGLTFLNGDGVNDTQMTFTGTISAINFALNGSVYVGTAQGGGIVQITTNDLGNTGDGGARSDTDTLNVTTLAAGSNAAPINNIPVAVQNATAGTPYFFSTNFGTQIFISDSDAGVNAVQVSISATNGTFTLSTNSSLNFTAGDGNADALMTFTGSLNAINTALAGSSFQGTANGGATVQITTNDLGNTGTGGAMQDVDTINLAVSASGANWAPINTTPAAQNAALGTSLVFSSGSGNAITASDADLGSNPVLVTLTAANGTLTLATTSGLTFTAGDGTADATLTFTGTIDAVKAALDGLKFDAASAAAASVTITTDDQGFTGSGGSMTDTDTVNITVSSTSGGNLPPVNTVPTSPLSVPVGNPLNFVGANQVSISDPDAASAELLVTIAAQNGTVSLASTSGLTFTQGDGTTDATMAFTGTLTSINAALATLTFTGTSPGAASVSITTNDQGNTGTGGAMTDSDVITITNVLGGGGNNPGNNPGGSGVAPVNTLPGTQTIGSGQSLVFGSGSTSLSGAWSIGGQATSIVQSGTQLTFTNEFGTSATGRVLSSTQVIADGWGGLIGSLSGNNVINWGNGTQWTRSDSGSTANALSVSFSTAAGSVSLVATGGTITLSQTGGLAFSSGDGLGDTSMTFTGSAASINAALAGAQFTSFTGFTGTATLSISTSDQATPVGTDTDSLSIVVTASSGTTPTTPTLDLGGVWFFNTQQTSIAQSGSSLTFTNERGEVAQGRVLSTSQVIADGWGGLTGAVSGNTRIEFANGDTWVRAAPVVIPPGSTPTIPSSVDVSGAWSINGQGTAIQQSGTQLVFTNEFGQSAQGRLFSDTQVIADGWGGLIGTIGNGNIISWSNGTVWTRAGSVVTPPTSSPTFTPPSLATNWSINGNQATRIDTNGTNLTFTNEFGATSSGRFLSEAQVVATTWGNLVGTLSANNTVIQWSNNTRWTASTDAGFSDPLLFA